MGRVQFERGSVPDCGCGLFAKALGCGLLLAGVIHSAITPAFAAPPPISIPVPDDTSGAAHPDDPFAFVKNWRRDQGLLGDMWGLRTELSHYGITLAIEETSEALGNVAGGFHQSLDYDGLTQAVLQVNSQRAFGYYGGTFNVSGLQLHGINLSQRNLGTLQTASGIDPTALPGCGNCGTIRSCCRRIGSTSGSASRASIRNGWSRRMRCCS